MTPRDRYPSRTQAPRSVYMLTQTVNPEEHPLNTRIGTDKLMQ